jgi:hypothetical protein
VRHDNAIDRDAFAFGNPPERHPIEEVPLDRHPFQSPQSSDRPSHFDPDFITAIFKQCPS